MGACFCLLLEDVTTQQQKQVTDVQRVCFIASHPGYARALQRHATVHYLPWVGLLAPSLGCCRSWVERA